MFLLLALIALASADLYFTQGSGQCSTTYYAGNFNNASFFGAPATFSKTDGTAHFSPLVIPSATVDATLEPSVIPLNITKSILGNFKDDNWFYNFPFAAGADCNTTLCPNVGPNAITTPPSGAPTALAGFFQNRDALYFDFSETIGAFGISFALRTTDVNHPTTPTLEFEFGFDDNTSHKASITPAVGGAMTRVFFEPNVVPLHSKTLNNVTIRFFLADVDNAGEPFVPIDGAWFVFNEVIYGQTGYNCEVATNTAALTINLVGLPETTAISYDGDSRETPVQGPWINDVGNQEVIICVPAGTPAISVMDNGYIFRSYEDASDPIICGSGHFSSFAVRCSLDPRAVLNLPVPCLPVLDGINFTISLTGQGVDFRNDLVAEIDPTYYVLATQFVSASMRYGTLATPAGSAYTCRKSNSQLSPATCSRSTSRGTISKKMEFRAKCDDTPIPSIPNAIDVSVWFSDTVTTLTWLEEGVENTDFELCVPSFGTFKYTSTEIGVNNVTSDIATTSCSAASTSTRCNTTPLDLVSIIEGPATCGAAPSCEGGNWPQNFVGGNQSYGFPTSLSYNGVLFRNFWQQPFQEIKYCVMNLNTVELSTKINTEESPLMTSLSAEYDCTDVGGSTPGVCSASASNPVNFFTYLDVDALKLPTGISYKIDYFEKTIEDGQIVCSCGTLANSLRCGAGNTYQKICIPAVGSNEVSRDCEADYLPSGIKVVAQECLGGSCFPNSNETCRPDSEQCINLEMPLDCRNGCSATLGKELCLWDMLALPKSSQTVALLAKDTNYDAAVRTESGFGGRPGYLTVLATEFRARISEGNSVYQVTSGEIACQTENCKWNDYLSIINVDEPLLYNGEHVLNGVTATIQGTSRSTYLVNGPRCVKKISVLADPVNAYNVTYEWRGFTRDITGITCEACPSQYCSKIEPLVRWFSIDPTAPTQEDYHIVIDGVGQVIAQDDQHEFKSYGNPWSANPLEVLINGSPVPSSTYGGTVCSPVANQQPFINYYTLASNSGEYNVTVKLGCDSEDYQIECPVGDESWDVATCATQCEAATYYRACRWLSEGSTPENLSGAQTVNCTGGCGAAWYALQPFVNNVLDLRCLPDGSSDIPDTLPTTPFNQNMYRGQAYTDFFGTQTTRYNPINVNLCCGGDCSAPNAPPSGPAGSSCNSPIVLEEAGGFQNVFTGLLHRVPTPYSITVQELFRTESSALWEEARPQEFIAECADMSSIMAQWWLNIQAVRPTKCVNDVSPTTTPCGPSNSRTCGYVYAQEPFVASLSKAAANNAQGLGQIKYTYGLQYLSQEYNLATPTSWNVVRPHTLLRPNKYASFADEFCVIEASWYNFRMFDDYVPTGSLPITCNTTICVDSEGTSLIPFQSSGFKK